MEKLFSRGLVRLLLVCAAASAIVLLSSSRASAQCVDQALKEQLVGQRAYRGVVPRLFKKALRSEVSIMGGWNAADLSSGAPIYGGAYTFYFTEDLGLEASYFRTVERYALLNDIIARQPQVALQPQNTQTVQLFMGHIIWSLAYGKVRWMGGAISRFDFYLAIGGGAVDAAGNPGPAGSGGFGMKFYLAQWLALRLDVRNTVHRQLAPLGASEIVNDVSAMGGLSLFIPFKS
jgi:outer membrane beta-barrel protein